MRRLTSQQRDALKVLGFLGGCVIGLVAATVLIGSLLQWGVYLMNSLGLLPYG